jgi:hypothetical protein
MFNKLRAAAAAAAVAVAPKKLPGRQLTDLSTVPIVQQQLAEDMSATDLHSL